MQRRAGQRAQQAVLDRSLPATISLELSSPVGKEGPGAGLQTPEGTLQHVNGVGVQGPLCVALIVSEEQGLSPGFQNRLVLHLDMSSELHLDMSSEHAATFPILPPADGCGGPLCLTLPCSNALA